MRFRLICIDPPDGADAKISEAVVEASPAFRVEDIIRNFEINSNKHVRAAFTEGQRLDEDDLLATVKMRTLTLTLAGPGFNIVEGSCLQMLHDRGEAYRLYPVLKSLREVNRACSKTGSRGSQAMRASSGSGGVYFLKSASSPGAQIHACFKPRDDEPGARNNPNEASCRKGVLPGEAAEREAAAFILDWGGFCGVPGTVLVEAACDMFPPDNSGQPLIGSFQHFVQNAVDTVGDFSPHLFSARQVHKIGLMDMRFLNMDRNDSNILVVRRHSDEYHLVPIDHGLCFPDRIEVGWCDWVWWDWPQTLLPFDEETREWVLGLDIEEDVSVLRQFSIRPACIQMYRCMLMLLKKGVAAGLNLRDLASVVVRSRDIDEPSAMEKTITRATELAYLMESNSRFKFSNQKAQLYHSSSFDGNLSMMDLVEKEVSDDLFFAYVDRLLEDIVAEVKQRKNGFTGPVEYNGHWFSASTRSSPSELTKIASPRLLPRGKLSPTDVVQGGNVYAFPSLNLLQDQ